METDIQTIRWILQLKIKFTQRQVTMRHSRLIARHNSLNATKAHVGKLQIGKKMDDINKWTLI